MFSFSSWKLTAVEFLLSTLFSSKIIIYNRTRKKSKYFSFLHQQFLHKIYLCPDIVVLCTSWTSRDCFQDGGYPCTTVAYASEIYWLNIGSTGNDNSANAMAQALSRLGHDSQHVAWGSLESLLWMPAHFCTCCLANKERKVQIEMMNRPFCSGSLAESLDQCGWTHWS